MRSLSTCFLISVSRSFQKKSRICMGMIKPYILLFQHFRWNKHLIFQPTCKRFLIWSFIRNRNAIFIIIQRQLIEVFKIFNKTIREFTGFLEKDSTLACFAGVFFALFLSQSLVVLVYLSWASCGCITSPFRPLKRGLHLWHNPNPRHPDSDRENTPVSEPFSLT